jgi:hypothetical protein
VYNQASDKWISVVLSFNKNTNTPVTLRKTEQRIMSSNHFSPLTNFKAEGLSLTSNSEWPTSTKSMIRNTNQPCAGNKIPTISNG